MKKFFVLDSNVLLYNPDCIFKFSDNNVIIPITVIEEINRFKRDLNSNGRNAREVARHLDKLRMQGNLSEGVKLDTGGSIQVVGAMERINVPENLDKTLNDNIILNNIFNGSLSFFVWDFC